MQTNKNLCFIFLFLIFILFQNHIFANTISTNTIFSKNGINNTFLKNSVDSIYQLKIINQVKERTTIIKVGDRAKIKIGNKSVKGKVLAISKDEIVLEEIKDFEQFKNTPKNIHKFAISDITHIKKAGFWKTIADIWGGIKTFLGGYWIISGFVTIIIALTLPALFLILFGTLILIFSVIFMGIGTLLLFSGLNTLKKHNQFNKKDFTLETEIEK